MTPPVPHRTATTVLTLVVPLAVAAVPFVAARAWASQLPDPVAVHFGPDGPDGFSSLAGALWPGAIATVVLAAACWAVAFFWGRTAMVRRIGVATALGLAAFLATLLVGTLSLQRGLADAADVVGVDPMITLALCVGLGVAALGAWLAPGDAPLPTTDPVPARAAMLDLAPDESAAWVTHAESRVALVLGGSGAALMLVLGVALSIPALPVTAVLLAAVVLSSTWFTVTVDRRGLTVRSAVGWPRLSVPLDEVVQAAAVTVSPFAEFGGWGYRVGQGGRVGVVLRTGEGLQVERSGGRSFVVTVDDAATGAALLNTLAARSRVG
ncbi:DUF1648 domain-containing protein [Cellulomonas fengjieae]|uniref:DUF1648 domain-containing protein n=1 Tax=Cellulomonas fengjieae TaxID=2819978 RepID=A0ABS3SGB8_9CELL|nr:DUF1648 domain-containing protein [Cellulomonas fengjieae]MBO3084539.1 DUF1648 domain-containing protein [Cellulomonas fengjieae]QVI67128.1 DUF1648 domain-containing protein [Cellulomonas fengjieae]